MVLLERIELGPPAANARFFAAFRRVAPGALYQAIGSACKGATPCRLARMARREYRLAAVLIFLRCLQVVVACVLIGTAGLV